MNIKREEGGGRRRDEEGGGRREEGGGRREEEEGRREEEGSLVYLHCESTVSMRWTPLKKSLSNGWPPSSQVHFYTLRLERHISVHHTKMCRR